LDNGLTEYGLPSREDFLKAVKTVDEKLAEGLAGLPAPDASGRRGL
jgi:hypothetical protein